MATATIYASAGDGEVRHGSNSSWATMRNASSGTSKDDTSTQAFACYSGNNAGDATTFAAARGYLPFDLSSIPGTATITAIDLVIKPYAEWHGAAGSMCVCSSSQASLTALATSDWGNAGTTEYVTSRPAFSSFTAGTYKTLALNAAGVAAATVGASGKLLICLRTSFDLDNSAPTNTTYGGVGLDYSERSGTGDDPYIVVTYDNAISKTYTADAIIQAQGLTSTYTADAIVNPDRWADTCTGTNSTNLESHTPTGPYGGAEASGSWTLWYPAGFPRLRVTSNKLYSYTSAAIASDAEYRHSQQFADASYSADFSIPGAHNDGGYGVLSLRHAGATPGASSGYQVYFSNGAYITAGTLRMEKIVSGTSTVLGSAYTIGTLSNASTYRVALVVDGDQISVKLNGVTVIGPVTDTAITAKGYVHLGLATPDGASASVGVQVDNLLVEPAPEQPTATFTADAIVAAAQLTTTFTADGIVFGTETKTFTADAVVGGERKTQTFTADAIVDGVSYTTSGTRATTGSPLALFPSNNNVGTHGAHYGLPDAVTLADGTKFVVARKATAHSEWDGTFVAKTMIPGGSWSSEATILDTAYDERDPSVGLLADGTLCMTWNRLEVNGTYGVGDDDYFYAPFMTCAAGLDPLVSANWSTPVHITGTGLANNWRVGTDILELTPGGRIVVALYGTPAYPPWTDNQCWIAYSDDGGATWGMLSLLDNGNAHTLSSSGEAQLALCSDGSVLAVYRTISSPWETWARRSTDGCATWSSEWRVAENSVNKTGMIVTPDGDHVIAYGLNATTLAFKQSWDDGDTFGSAVNTGYSANLYAQPFAIDRVGASPNVAIAYAYENVAQTLASVYYIELTSTGTPYALRDTTYTADAIVSASGGAAQTKTFTADAVVYEPPRQATYTADGIVFATNTKTFTADTVIVDSASQSTALSWFFRRRRSSMSQQTKTYTVVQAKGTTRTATWTSPTYEAKTEVGILVVLDVTAASGTGGLTLRINAQDSAGSVSVPLNSAPTAVTATGTTSYSVYPFGAISGALTQSTSGYLPRQFSITVTAGDSSSYTYSIGYCLLP